MARPFFFARVLMEEQEEHDGLLPELPHESWFRIFSFLSPSNSLHVCLTCKLWNELWQDKALWKHFHHSLLGGRPRPPLLPNAWKKGFKESFVCMRIARDANSRLDYALKHGHTVVVQKMMETDTKLFHPLPLHTRRFFFHYEPTYSNHPLVIVTNTQDLQMFQFLWAFYFPSPSTSEQQPPAQSPDDQRRMEQTVMACAENMVVRRDASMLRHLFSVASQFPVVDYVKTPGNWHLEIPLTLNFLALVEELGAGFQPALLNKNLGNAFVAHWLLDRVKGWQLGSMNILRRAVIEENAPRSVVKRLLKEGASAFSWGKLLEEYASGGVKVKVLDKKVLKWLLKKHEEAQGCKEENLAFYVGAIEKGDTKILRFLIKIGATDVNHVHPEWGKTLLQIAVEKGNTVMARTLLACGADPKAKGKKVAAPISIANQMGLTELRDILVEASKVKEQVQGAKRKRQQEANDTKVNGDCKGGEKGAEKEEVAEEVKSVKKRKISPGAAEEKKLEARVAELHQWISERDGVAARLQVPIQEAKMAGFSYGKVKRACYQLRLRPTSLKKLALLQALVQFLEDKEAVVAYEL